MVNFPTNPHEQTLKASLEHSMCNQQIEARHKGSFHKFGPCLKRDHLQVSILHFLLLKPVLKVIYKSLVLMSFCIEGFQLGFIVDWFWQEKQCPSKATIPSTTKQVCLSYAKKQDIHYTTITQTKSRRHIFLGKKHEKTHVCHQISSRQNPVFQIEILWKLMKRNDQHPFHSSNRSTAPLLSVRDFSAHPLTSNWPCRWTLQRCGGDLDIRTLQHQIGSRQNIAMEAGVYMSHVCVYIYIYI